MENRTRYIQKFVKFFFHIFLKKKLIKTYVNIYKYIFTTDTSWELLLYIFLVRLHSVLCHGLICLPNPNDVALTDAEFINVNTFIWRPCFCPQFGAHSAPCTVFARYHFVWGHRNALAPSLTQPSVCCYAFKCYIWLLYKWRIMAQANFFLRITFNLFYLFISNTSGDVVKLKPTVIWLWWTSVEFLGVIQHFSNFYASGVHIHFLCIKYSTIFHTVFKTFVCPVKNEISYCLWTQMLSFIQQDVKWKRVKFAWKYHLNMDELRD